jgi:hypothetical protein
MRLPRPSHLLPIFLTLALGFLTSGSHAFADATTAFRTLVRIDAFAFGGIGIVGTISPGEAAFREILAGPHPTADFRTLLEKGNAPARCYALVALHVLDPATFHAAAARFERSDTPVQTIGGCIISTLPFRSVLANISKGDYDSFVNKSKDK